MPKGMLLSGSPGTGKTFLAAVIASEANLPFIYIDASSLRGMFLGMTELMIMKLFRDARGLARKYAQPGQRGACIMFMDEIDSIGMNRGGQGNAGGQGMVMGGMMMGGGQGLNTLLNQMDSLTEIVEDRWRYKVLRWFGIVRGTGQEQAARLRHRRDEPAGRARPGADPARAGSTGSSRCIGRTPRAGATSSSTSWRRSRTTPRSRWTC